MGLVGPWAFRWSTHRLVSMLPWAHILAVFPGPTAKIHEYASLLDKVLAASTVQDLVTADDAMKTAVDC